MNIGVGLKCPNGHMKVQNMIGEPTCHVCGVRLVPDESAPSTSLNRRCKHCGMVIAWNVSESGFCPQCKKPWD